MKKTLVKAPLVHALIHLRFSEVPALKAITPELQKELHLRMVDEGFPEKIMSTAELVELQFDPVTQQMKHTKTSKERLLFRAEGEREIIEISEASIILKSTCYSTFNEFYNRFHKVLIGCQEVISGLDKSLLKNVGLRYVDVIVPSEGSSLTDFVEPGLKPPTLTNYGKHLQGHSLKAVEVAEGQILVVNFEELPCLENKVSKVLPDNLIEPDSKCGLVISGQTDWLNVASETYGILDIDHTFNFVRSPKFDVKQIQTATNKLYQQASDIFWDVTTQKAQNSWGYKEV